jgi:hypothetical protein
MLHKNTPLTFDVTSRLLDSIAPSRLCSASHRAISSRTSTALGGRVGDATAPSPLSMPLDLPLAETAYVDVALNHAHTYPQTHVCTQMFTYPHTHTPTPTFARVHTTCTFFFHSDAPPFPPRNILSVQHFGSNQTLAVLTFSMTLRARASRVNFATSHGSCTTWGNMDDSIGRAGRAGVCIICYTPSKMHEIGRVERKAGIKFTQITAPSRVSESVT